MDTVEGLEVSVLYFLLAFTAWVSGFRELGVRIQGLAPRSQGLCELRDSVQSSVCG